MELQERITKVALKDYSSLRVGGEAEYLETSTMAELVEVLMYAKKEGKRVHILGSGTNTYFGENLENLFVVKICMKGISCEDFEESVLLTAYAGEIWDDLVHFSTNQNLWGIENLSYIPGTVGAAPVQNIGAYGAELKDVFVSLSALDRDTLDVVAIDRDACDFGYRDSLFKHEAGKYVILSVTMRLSKKTSPRLSYKPLDALLLKEDITPQEVRELVVATRKAKLPEWKEHPNAGSFFKNPVITKVQFDALRFKYPDVPVIPHTQGFKIPAAWLIEHIGGMKGVRVGDVATWPNQPLVIVNYGDASADEIDEYKEEIRKKIQEAVGIVLEQEVNRVD